MFEIWANDFGGRPAITINTNSAKERWEEGNDSPWSWSRLGRARARDRSLASSYEGRESVSTRRVLGGNDGANFDRTSKSLSSKKSVRSHSNKYALPQRQENTDGRSEDRRREALVSGSFA
jgi:hypothetical protein